MKKDLDDRLKILIKKVKKDEFIWFTQAFRDRNPSENEFKLYSLLVEAIQSQRALQKVEKEFCKDYTRGLEEVLRRKSIGESTSNNDVYPYGFIQRLCSACVSHTLQVSNNNMCNSTIQQ